MPDLIRPALEGWFVAAGIVALLTAALLVAFAVVVFRANSTRPANMLLGFFLLLIAGNAVTDAVLKWVDPASWGGTLVARLGLAFLAIDPGILLYFSAIYPRRSRWADHFLTLPVLAGVWLGFMALLIFSPTQLTSFPRSSPAGIALLTYLGACYLGSYALMLRRLRRETSPVLAKQLAWLVGALGITTIFRAALIPTEWISFPFALFGPLSLVGLHQLFLALLTSVLALSVFAVAWAWSLWGAPEASRPALRHAHRLTLIGLAVLALISTVPVAANLLLRLPPGEIEYLIILPSSVGFVLRWVLFAALTAYAILRYQVLDIDLRVRQIVGAAASGAALFGLAAVVWVVGGFVYTVDPRDAPIVMLFLTASVVLGPPVAGRAASLARRLVPGEESPDPHARRLEIYRASMEISLRGGQIAPEAEAELKGLRRELGISETQHRVLLDIVRLERGGRLADAAERLVGRYEHEGSLGQGTQGRCRLARDALLGRKVVIKEVPLLSGDDRSALREARAAGRLSHPNIVVVHDIVETPGMGHIVMEYVAGGNLRELLLQGPMDPQRSVHLVAGMLAGLAAAHAAGIVHGDLKPENVLLTQEGHAKLGDFGSARALGPSVTLGSMPTRAGAGTLLYMAPEQVEGSAPSPASDLYAVAAIAHEVFIGGHYLELRGKGDFQIREAILRADPRAEHAGSLAMNAWLARGLAKDPKDRWDSAGAMALALAEADGVSAQPSTSP